MKKIILSLMCSAAGLSASAQCSDLFFSEYLEGSSNNKALEIYNPTSAAINLADYTVYRFNNGSPTASDSLFPQGMLASGDVYVIANPSAVATILNVSDTTHTITFYNGDDAIVLHNNLTATDLDIIGIVGVDPGTNWAVGSGATSEFTLVRMMSVNGGTTNWTQSATEWDVYPQNTDSLLGWHSMTPCSAPLSATVASTDVTCNGGSDGSATVTASGGNSFTYSWAPNGDTTATSSALMAGTYTCTVANDLGDTVTVTVTINEPAPIVVTLALTTADTICQNAGMITLGGGSPAGGTWGGPGVSGNQLDPSQVSPGLTLINYFYTDSNNCSGMATDSVYIDICMGIAQQFAANGIRVYPNPATDLLTIENHTAAGTLVFTITDASGRTIDRFTGSNTVNTISISALDSGIYFLRIENGTQVENMRFVKE